MPLQLLRVQDWSVRYSLVSMQRKRWHLLNINHWSVYTILLVIAVTGGHTVRVLMKDHEAYEVIGETLDDAAGEALDKVVRMLDLPYPVSPHIFRLAPKGEESIVFPRVWLEKDRYDSSFSG